MEKISIIVPIYEVKEYLKKCVDSILNQTYKNLEVILVDDGSTDGGELICDDYLALDSRVKVIHKENGGLVSARKAGMRLAEGEYIGYVDSDDWVAPNMYERLYVAMQRSNSDIVVCSHYEVDDNNIQEVQNFIDAGVYKDEKLVNFLFPKMMYEPTIYKWGLSPAAWDKLYRREIVEKFQMEVDERICEGEDQAFVYPAILHSNCVEIIRESLYYHRVRKNSISLACDERCFEKISYLFQSLKKQCKQTPYWHIIKESLSCDIRWYLFKHIRIGLGVSSVDYRMLKQNRYLFPFQRVKQSSNIGLYGAGKVGWEFYHQLNYTNYCNIVVWVDKNHEKINRKELIKNPQELSKINLDYVVIAIENEKIANEMIHSVEKMGVDRGKIIWEFPRY